jgi:hypothetical protein
MAEFLFQLRGKSGDGYSSNWSWPPIWTDKVTASSRKEAHSQIEEQFSKKFPLRVLQKDIGSNEFLLVIKEIRPDDKHTISLFDLQTCKQCGRQFKVIEKYQQGNDSGGGRDFCSYACSAEFNKVEKLRYAGDIDEMGSHVPVIYRITNKETGKCYIGKTTQAFTLRWYQHFFQCSGTKFHDEIKKYDVTKWLFEVIEIIELPPHLKTMAEVNHYIFEREMHHIRSHNSIDNGYNSVCSKATDAEKLINP